MLPATQSSLVSQMRVTYPTRNVSAEMGRYLDLEYGVNASAARTLIGRATRVQRVRMRTGTAGAVRRFLVSVFEAVSSIRASPGGA